VRIKPPPTQATHRTKLTLKPFVGGRIVVHADLAHYPSGQPCAVWLSSFTVGSQRQNDMRTMGLLLSRMLQHGLPITELVDVLSGVKDDNQGRLELDDSGDWFEATSIWDAIAFWLREEAGIE
jgi:hypothetical protein